MEDSSNKIEKELLYLKEEIKCTGQTVNQT